IAGTAGPSDRASSRSRKSRAPSSGIATAFCDGCTADVMGLGHANGSTSPSHGRPSSRALRTPADLASLVAIVPVAAIAVGIGPIPAEVGSWTWGHGAD